MTAKRHWYVTALVIVGQAFAGPMLEHLDADPGRYDLSSVRVISLFSFLGASVPKFELARPDNPARSWST